MICAIAGTRSCAAAVLADAGPIAGLTTWMDYVVMRSCAAEIGYVGAFHAEHVPAGAAHLTHAVTAHPDLLSALTRLEQPQRWAQVMGAALASGAHLRSRFVPGEVFSATTRGCRRSGAHGQLGVLAATLLKARTRGLIHETFARRHRVAGCPDRCAAARSLGQCAGHRRRTAAWHGARLGFVGRVVKDLDRSVAFYKMIGFTQDPQANPAWRTDPVVEGLYGVKGITTRMAKMYVVNPDSGQHFVVYLREVKGIRRTDRSQHTAWDPGATHFGLVVADADQVWANLQAAGVLHARSWGGKLIAPPGQTKGMLAYITDPDGLDIELINQRPAIAGPERPARAAGMAAGRESSWAW